MYYLSETALRKALAQRGYRGITDFASRNKLNRNTIHNYLRGQSVFSTQFKKLAQALGQSPLDLVAENPGPEAVVKLPDGIRSIVDMVCDQGRELCVVLFGSRTGMRHHKFADWDLGVCSARGRMPYTRFLVVKSKVEDLAENLPVSVDFVNLDSAPDWFLKGMANSPQFLGGSGLAWLRFIRLWESHHEVS